MSFCKRFVMRFADILVFSLDPDQIPQGRKKILDLLKLCHHHHLHLDKKESPLVFESIFLHRNKSWVNRIWREVSGQRKMMIITAVAGFFSAVRFDVLVVVFVIASRSFLAKTPTHGLFFLTFTSSSSHHIMHSSLFPCNPNSNSMQY